MLVDFKMSLPAIVKNLSTKLHRSWQHSLLKRLLVSSCFCRAYAQQQLLNRQAFSLIADKSKDDGAPKDDVPFCGVVLRMCVKLGGTFVVNRSGFFAKLSMHSTIWAQGYLNELRSFI